MPMVKADYLKDCNSYGVALEDFLTQFCARCLQPECTRSQHGASKFDQRVTTWESRLFRDVPRMTETDPRFKVISAKRFIQIDTGRVPEIRSWVDPRNLAEPDVAAPPPETVPLEIPQVQVVAVAEPGVPANPVKNTPNRRGQMIGGKKVDGGGSEPVLDTVSDGSIRRDPWETKKTPEKKTEGKVVQPGAKIRLGGS